MTELTKYTIALSPNLFEYLLQELSYIIEAYEWPNDARKELAIGYLRRLREASETSRRTETYGYWEYEIAAYPKQLREVLCSLQIAVTWAIDFGIVAPHMCIRRIGCIIDACDAHRPLGPDGKHGDRHTKTCGCDETPLAL
jgi:hypothetical protein